MPSGGKGRGFKSRRVHHFLFKSYFDSRYLEDIISNNKELNEVTKAEEEFIKNNKFRREELIKAINSKLVADSENIISEGAWVNVYNEYGRTALISAAKNGHEEIKEIISTYEEELMSIHDKLWWKAEEYIKSALDGLLKKVNMLINFINK